MEILIAAGGDPGDWPEKLPAFDYYVGIDRGSLFLLERGLPLKMAVGDFDSLAEEERKRVFAATETIKKSVPEKDDTDTQLALAAVFEAFPQAEVTLIGVTGGRLDHLLANIYLGVEERFAAFIPQITLWDRQNVLRYLLPGEHVVTKVAGMHYLAYVCLTAVSHLTLKKSKYLLQDVTVTVPTSYASNEFIGETAEISFASGIIAVIQSKDQ